MDERSKIREREREEKLEAHLDFFADWGGSYEWAGAVEVGESEILTQMEDEGGETELENVL